MINTHSIITDQLDTTLDSCNMAMSGFIESSPDISNITEARAAYIYYYYVFNYWRWWAIRENNGFFREIRRYITLCQDQWHRVLVHYTRLE